MNNNRHRYFFDRLFSVCLLTILLGACATSPEGRKQLQLVSDDEMNTLGVQSFENIKQKTNISQDKKLKQYVLCVARQIIPQVKQSPDPNQWEVVLFDDPQANAFALPGNKIGVYTGLLKYAQNQHQLAAVIGHEVAHVIARHGSERVSNQMATQAGLSIASILLGTQGNDNNDLIMAGIGLGAQYGVLLPFSRSHESEADLIGLDLMAASGFDPEQSISLWQNMSAAGQSPPEFMSTHPSNETRIKQLRNRLPKARKLREQALAAGKKPSCHP